MANNKNLIADRLKKINEDNKSLKNDKPNVVDNIVTGKEEKPDFMKMAEVLEEKKRKEPGKNENYQKDTIYIRQDLYNALQALCINQGDKKKFVNEMYEDFLTKKYKELRNELHVDK